MICRKHTTTSPRSCKHRELDDILGAVVLVLLATVQAQTQLAAFVQILQGGHVLGGGIMLDDIARADRAHGFGDHCRRTRVGEEEDRVRLVVMADVEERVRQAGEGGCFRVGIASRRHSQSLLVVATLHNVQQSLAPPRGYS